MIYAQIKNGVVENCISISDLSNAHVFSEGFDYFIRVDNLTPQPGMGWGYDGETFSPPIEPPPPEDPPPEEP